ncbi:hypothetical protein [Streptomyces sp. JNUCC 63]
MAEANLALFEYIDGCHNPRRTQKRLGHLEPIEFEEKHHADQAAAKQANLKPRQSVLIGQSAPPAHQGNLTAGPPSPPTEEGGQRRRSGAEETHTPTPFPQEALA